ncbi:MAG TPA: VWA domain-containing protein [Anaerolineaceae bacterium]|nr:VWA domain-containing protein [Anaerolineaceae bacterium]HPN53960.1 VWA domain-containing protein [Anaerolineaceae bacterium]
MDSNPQETVTRSELLRRWRLILGSSGSEGLQVELNQNDQAMDRSLEALYEAKGKGGLGASSPNVARWLGDIRNFFPSSVVRIMQMDALERLNLKQMLLEPELLDSVEADVHLVANLVALRSLIPGKTLATAKEVVRRVVRELERKLSLPMRQAVTGSLNRAVRNRRPRLREIDWHRTIRANLKNYQPEYRSVVPEVRIGYGHKRSKLRDIILCVDQSGSMASSVVYSGIFAAVLASLSAVSTRLVVFDTAVVDLTDQMTDPVEMLFGIQLGGGTDINSALAYCTSQITRPQDTILVLISDLYEGGNAEEMIQRAGLLVSMGVQVVALLALDDAGRPSYDHHNAQRLSAFGIPVFGCTPDQFPDLMAAALQRRNLQDWAAGQGIQLSWAGQEEN